MSSTRPNESIVSVPLVEAWRADTASAGELRQGYARFMRQQATSGVPRIARWLVVGLVFGVGLAQAASIAVPRLLGSPGRQELNAAPAKPAPQNPPARPAVAKPSAVEVEPQPGDAAEKPAAEKPAFPGASAQTLAPAPGAAAGARYVQQQWQQAAAALRDKDFAKAHTALSEIERSAGSSEREAARLARAQLLASHGRTAEALSLANELTERASSSLVRDKAHDLLRQISEKSPTQRSIKPGTAINQP